MENLQHDVNNIKTQINGLYNSQNHLEKKMDRILMLLEGDSADPDSGFINRLKAIESFISWLKIKKSYFMGNISALIFLAGAIGTVIMFIVKVIEFFRK